MRVRISNLLPLLVALLLAGLTLWLRIAVEAPSTGDSGRFRHDPDAVVDDFTVTRLDEQGAPRYTLSAEHMVHFADDDSTELVAPRFVRRGAGPTLTVTAKRGSVTHDGEEAFLHDDVLIVREATPEHEELRVHTNYLHILAEQDIARTDEPVTIAEGRSVLSGVGMEFEKDQSRFKLYSRVRGTFEQIRK